ncbi:guanine-N(7)--methyltransferase subunit TRM82 [Westerdykella ornata]|uniref:Guanine-N(7)--methyltransferase subunit TRM82 n=1 Tax=Westerdykella ornata TaxID=318751 RepID=A0A6A6JQN2_WESOR|nr:guanine-N(7)--methyltransferase subunit TRM82 [Westerdykella ornata]KAF2278208.1 guanine-N(7)--methyltransferase subunit TRM82 [Westerdykella ornata]
MALPYSCIEACRLSTNGADEWALIAASGTRLVVQSSSGAYTTWPPASGSAVGDTEAEGPPGKKIKLSDPSENTSNFSCLALTHDQKHIIAVTAEDKCIRVFRIDTEFQLQQLSQRCMTRRPCAIAMTSDDSTILCADKFGDVYSLPLLPGPEDEQIRSPSVEQSEAAGEKAFVPAASVLTVHSGRNRRVLEEQLKQAAKGPKKPKEGPTFKHDLLLGHVSMLTDIAYANVNGRSYIITADRDEHIRVSRGPPQAHIIEGFCYGHESFVSRLCLVGPDRLVSGGGDPDLFVWDWTNFELLGKLHLRDAVLRFLREQPDLAARVPEDANSFRIAVSGIWHVPSEANEILAACEGIPALFSFRIGISSTAEQCIVLTGNALDVTFIRQSQTGCTAVVSVDNVHVRVSTTERREAEATSRLEYFSYRPGGQWEQDAETGRAFERISQSGGHADKEASLMTSTTGSEKALGAILYGIENLRKRPDSDD